MSIGNQITGKLNYIEDFIDKSPPYLFPLKVIGWIVLLLALIVSNFIALAQWPLSAIAKKLGKKSSQIGQPIEVTSESELNNIIADNNIVLVDFWAQWCGPCLLMASTISNIAKEQVNQVTVVKVDVSLNSDLSKSYGVRGLPTVIVFKGAKEVTRKSGS